MPALSTDPLLMRPLAVSEQTLTSSPPPLTVSSPPTSIWALLVTMPLRLKGPVIVISLLLMTVGPSPLRFTNPSTTITPSLVTVTPGAQGDTRGVDDQRATSTVAHRGNAVRVHLWKEPHRSLVVQQRTVADGERGHQRRATHEQPGCPVQYWTG